MEAQETQGASSSSTSQCVEGLGQLPCDVIFHVAKDKDRQIYLRFISIKLNQGKINAWCPRRDTMVSNVLVWGGRGRQTVLGMLRKQIHWPK